MSNRADDDGIVDDLEENDVARAAERHDQFPRAVGMTGFGASGPAEELYRHFGIAPETIVAEARRLLANQPESALA